MGKKSGLVMSLVANRLAVSPKAQVARSRLIPQQNQRARRSCPKVRLIISKCGSKFRAAVSSRCAGKVKFVSGQCRHEGMTKPNVDGPRTVPVRSGHEVDEAPERSLHHSIRARCEPRTVRGRAPVRTLT